MIQPLAWQEGQLKILDQRKVPWSLEYITCTTSREVAVAIQELAVRGAPAIGAAAAFGLALAARGLPGPGAGDDADPGLTPREFGRALEEEARELEGARPTAVNLSWAVRRMMGVYRGLADRGRAEILRGLEEEARQVFLQDIAVNRRMGELGAGLVPPGSRVLTHCNAGALATAGYGTALGVIRKAHRQGKVQEVYVDETRPVLQGARLTAWELKEEGIPHVLVTDNMAGMLMQKKLVDMVLVGADRIASNGDTANKIGTYSLAVLAAYHRLPFYVAAPSYTFDLGLDNGEGIVIEERDPAEVTCFSGQEVAPAGTRAFNPSFDVTPHTLIRAIITEKGIIHGPGRDKISNLLQG